MRPRKENLSGDTAATARQEQRGATASAEDKATHQDTRATVTGTGIKFCSPTIARPPGGFGVRPVRPHWGSPSRATHTTPPCFSFNGPRQYPIGLIFLMPLTVRIPCPAG